MKNGKTILLLRLVMIFLGFSYNHINAQDVTGSWSGTVSLRETVTYALGNSERQITIFFTDNKGTGTVVENGEYIIGGKLFCKSSCSGSGNAELHEVTIDNVNSTYRIHAISPPSTCTNTGPYCEQPTTNMQELDIIVSERPLNSGPNVLAGSETKVNDLAANGKVTTTITWNLVRQIDVELIVTPQTYDTWLPIPGKDEATQGSVINILLKVQGKNGRPLLQKAKAFELRLSNTSREPGITLNVPLNPSDAKPDLRFQMQPGADTSEAGQFISIACQSPCLTANANIAAFDGGGWTTLTAFAILEDDTPIKGSLLVPGGKQEIPIPKRNAGSIIATAWLDANGNPKEMDDKDSLAGNTNKGDGLTAYEEYRGVISQGKFLRLDPKKKEIGIDVIKPELSFFSEGIKWFENATGLTAVIFHEDLNEIDIDRRLNKNALTNHDYAQYVLKLYKSVIPGGMTLGKAYGGPGIPAKIFAVVIDYDGFPDEYLYWQNHARTLIMTMPFTLKDLVANTVVHELGHGVNCWHHGPTKDGVNDTARAGQPVRIFNNNGNEINLRPYPLAGSGMKGNQESGDLSCIMAYVPYCKWAYSKIGGTHFFYMSPILNVGKKMCINSDGTSINKKDARGNNNYFGDATKGNCLSQIKLRD